MSLNLAIILFGISLIINIFLGFFAIFYPIRITSRDYAEISKMTKDILEISKIIHIDLKSVEDKIRDNVMAIPSLDPIAKKLVNTAINSVFNQISPLMGWPPNPRATAAYKRCLKKIKNRND